MSYIPKRHAYFADYVDVSKHHLIDIFFVEHQLFSDIFVQMTIWQDDRCAVKGIGWGNITGDLTEH